MNNQPDRLDQIAALLQETVQITRSNSISIAANSAAISATNAALASTSQKLDGLVETIAEYSIRTEARLNRLDDIVDRLDRLLEEISRRTPPHI